MINTMNTQNDTIDLIRHRLKEAFHPLRLMVTDDSRHHIGHAGSLKGGHYAVEITTTIFEGKSRAECHRLIYQVLDDLMKTQIHALRIITKAS